MSFGFRSPIPPDIGIPSSTYSGSLEAVSERSPRTRMLMPSPGLLPVVMISTPATRPLRASTAFAFGTAVTSPPDTEVTEPHVLAGLRAVADDDDLGKRDGQQLQLEVSGGRTPGRHDHAGDLCWRVPDQLGPQPVRAGR